MTEVQNPPEGFGRVTPYLLVANVGAEIDFLVSKVGFVETLRMPGPDGSAIHGEVTTGGAVVMLGVPGPDFKNPKALGAATQLVYVYVDDVDAHFAAAEGAGVGIIRPLADQFYGDRTYTVEDPEGHQWTFAQHTRDVAPEDLHP